MREKVYIELDDNTYKLKEHIEKQIEEELNLKELKELREIIIREYIQALELIKQEEKEEKEKLYTGGGKKIKKVLKKYE